MRITDNLYLLSGAGYKQIGNVYAIVNDEKIFLIDCGKDEEALEIINENLIYHRLDSYPITHVLITHMHGDHSANCWYFREKGAKILASASDADGIEHGGPRVNDFGNHWTEPFYKTCKVDRHLADEEIFDINGVTIKSLIMPGHTNGSLFFLFDLDSKSIVATGDTLFPIHLNYDGEYDASLGWPGSFEMDKEKYKQSLLRATSINADILIAGHGMPVMRNGSYLIGCAAVKAMYEFR